MSYLTECSHLAATKALNIRNTKSLQCMRVNACFVDYKRDGIMIKFCCTNPDEINRNTGAHLQK